MLLPTATRRVSDPSSVMAVAAAAAGTGEWAARSSVNNDGCTVGAMPSKEEVALASIRTLNPPSSNAERTGIGENTVERERERLGGRHTHRLTTSHRGQSSTPGGLSFPLNNRLKSKSGPSPCPCFGALVSPSCFLQSGSSTSSRSPLISTRRAFSRSL